MRRVKFKPNFLAEALCLDMLEESTKSPQVQVVALERESMGVNPGLKVGEQELKKVRGSGAKEGSIPVFACGIQVG